MFSWLTGDKKKKEVFTSVSAKVRDLYKKELLPLEEAYRFGDFHSVPMDNASFEAKPMILLVGQYSTGKTTFVQYLLEEKFHGMNIGPEPTTDSFIAVMHGEDKKSVPGNACVVDPSKQFGALQNFGNAFLNRFQCSTLPNKVLESITIIDTPGILSGEKQRLDRGYDFTRVIEWFAQRVDRIILLFEVHKLDISDEFKRCIEAMRGNEDKIRIVLNKADQVDQMALLRVYGALMWNLGRVFKTPEVPRVYIGSFWDQPLMYDVNRELFQAQQEKLFEDLQELPQNSITRKLNDLMKRQRLAKVHAFIISELGRQMPSLVGKEKKKKDLIQNLDKLYEQIRDQHNIPEGDFPNPEKLKERLEKQDFSKFPSLNHKLLSTSQHFANEIGKLLEEVKNTGADLNGREDVLPKKKDLVRGGAFSAVCESATPFAFGKGVGFDKGAGESEWVVNQDRSRYDSEFDSLGPTDGKIFGKNASLKAYLQKSKLPNSMLSKIWVLADVDGDGWLDADEFALINHLISLKLEGHELPENLPEHLVPPSKRSSSPVYPKLDG